MADKAHLIWAPPDPMLASTRYVWDVEDAFPTAGVTEVQIGELRISLDLQFPHERRYALGYLFRFRNPQADIDAHLFRETVQKGDVVLDVGANIGITAAEALACGAVHVLCVEPETSLVARLKRLECDYPNQISVKHCALGASVGTGELRLSHLHNQGHTLSPLTTNMFPQIFDGKSQRVRVSTIDDLIPIADKRPSVWKIDAEGCEADVIRGGGRTLELFPPRVILAELYDPIVHEMVALLPRYAVQRAALRRSDYALQLLDRIGGPLPNEFCRTSPTYVFSFLS
jgi:FkbM family methyltransferase